MSLALSRIIELEWGKIEIDGVDISRISLHELRSKITVIPQDPTLFTGTLKFNLDPADREPDHRLIAILEEAGLFHLSLDTQISENGQNLSSGERQLICICRAVLRDSKVVILDEATSNIDIVTEQKIQEMLSSHFKDSTMLVIAHRLNTIIHSDKVLVLSFGKVAEYDSPSTLMQDKDS